MAKVVGGHALQHSGGARSGIQSIRHLDQAGSWYYRLLGVRPGGAAVGNDVTFFHLGNARPDASHCSGPFHADGPGKGLARVGPHAVVDIGKVDAHGLYLHQGLSFSRAQIRHVLVLHGLGAAVLRYLYCFHDSPS